MRKAISGVLTAIVTPFTAEGALNLPALRQQVQRQLAAGNGIFCGGTNGEFFVLNEEEKIAVARTCVEEAAGRAPVVAHIGEVSTRETRRLGQQIARLGVDAVSAITPWFVPLKQEELINHYTAIADALSVPLFLYNIPARTGNTIAPETARQLARHENIVGIKDSAGSYDSLKGFLDAVRDIDGFDVLNGPDSLIHQGFVDGCSACISGLANVAPAEINAIWSRFHAGDIAGSRQAQEQVTGLRTDLYKVAFSPAAVKKALQLMGHEVGDSRYAVQFSDHQLQQIKIGLILNTARQIYQAISETKAGNWPRIFATDVYGKTLGIVGLGHIGKEVARRARGFNMRVLATDAWPDREFAQQHQIEYVSLATLTAQSDFISLHTPLTPETENMFNAARLQQMKSGAFLINVSRGGIVDEQALYEALKSGHLAGAAADVFLEEPCATHPLFTLANFAPTSHIAGYTDGAISNISARCVNNIITCVCRGERPENIMNSL
ncbi:hypothetical protein HC133_10995 [Klebsiella pneumoniae]|nr:dihydrodipicolinate synthase family protein [Klebsiella pneumoniae]MDK7817410.1 dihydrodipicolinate synthase family protein [Klebsiella pneumoniae]NJI89376.1 hypothetical protein [Klebsiella pneumoniae]NJJ91541.1 hypothetical protein [Klebsiella pneumoniae]NJK03136.1 hypothetical protein [Klebsiella pneumoniae]